MDRRDDASRTDPDASAATLAVPARDEEPAGARDALRATPNQQSVDDEDAADDAARNSHGAEDAG